MTPSMSRVNKLLMFAFLATWGIVMPSTQVLVSAQQCDNALTLARTRMQRSSCGSQGSFTCPADFCTNDGVGTEIAFCDLDNYIDLTSSGISMKFSTVGYSKNDGVNVETGEGTVVTISGNVQGNASMIYLGTDQCVVQVNGYDCACQLEYCSGDQTLGAVAQANCNNLGQGTLDWCDTVNYGSPGDILGYLVAAYRACDATSTNVPTGSGTAAPTTGGGMATNVPSPGGGMGTDAPATGGGTPTGGGSFPGFQPPSTASAGLLEMAHSVQHLWMIVAAMLAVLS